MNIIGKGPFRPEVKQTYLGKLELIKIEDLVKELKRIDITKSSGFIKINNIVFKLFFLLSPECLLHILNRCIITNTFPMCWKISLTTPIPKKGDTRLLKNIRPISILPLPGKLLERFINMDLTDYLEVNGLLCKEQGGFRRNHSTSKSCYDILFSVFNANNTSQSTIITYIDFAKAFHTINYDLLYSVHRDNT